MPVSYIVKALGIASRFFRNCADNQGALKIMLRNVTSKTFNPLPASVPLLGRLKILIYMYFTNNY